MESFKQCVITLTNDILPAILLLVLALAAVVSVMEWVGFLPKWLSTPLAKHRVADIKNVLEEMGVDFRKEKNMRLMSKLSVLVGNKDQLVNNTNEVIKMFLKRGDFRVGKTHQISSGEFVDLMSASCDQKEAVYIARCLSTFWSNNLQGHTIDFIATPKSGSPIIGYEFSRLLKKPLVLHECNDPKYQSQDASLEALSKFDAAFELTKGMVGLIVDDSTTGGRKVLELAEDLRGLGCEVRDCLVVFAPQGKGALEKLRSSGIKLHSIVERK